VHQGEPFCCWKVKNISRGKNSLVLSSILNLDAVVIQQNANAALE
jgi:hypothetical protein